MKAFDFLVKADTSKLPTFATKEETEVLCELMEQYANQRVIEELEKLEEFMHTECKYRFAISQGANSWEHYKELKQE